MEKFALSSLLVFQDVYLQMLLLVSTVIILSVVSRSRPTWLCFALMALPIPVLLLGFTTTGNSNQWQWANIITPIFCIILLLDGLILSPFKKQLNAQVQVRRYIPEKLSIGRCEDIVIHITNQANQAFSGILWENPPQAMLSPSSGTLKATSFSIPSQGSSRLEYKLTADRRGTFRFGKMDVHIKSRLGLLWQTTTMGRESNVQVYPDLKRMDEMRVRYTKSITSGEIQRKHLGSEGLRFNSLRQYASGDDIKKMDWKATARLGLPVTRTYLMEAEQPVYILWDAGRKMQSLRKKRADAEQTSSVFLSQFDWALNAGLAFASVAISRGDTIGGCVFHQEILKEIPAKKGKLHFLQLIDTLTKIQPQAIEPDYQLAFHQVAKSLKQRSLIILFTDIADPIAGQSLVKHLKLLTNKHQLIIINLGNDDLKTLESQVPDTVLKAYEKGIASGLYQQHQQLLTSLKKQQHAIIIDTTPEKLDEALIESYLSKNLQLSRV